MEVEKIFVEIFISGQNVTEDVSPFVSQITYTDKLEAESDDISMVLEDTEKVWQTSWYPSQGDMLSIKLGYPKNMLDCGDFEIDETELEIPPDTITIKAIAAAITKELRTKNSKAFEEQTLKQIAQQIAAKHSLTLTGNTGELEKILIDRKTQDNQTDISFLCSLAREYGLVFSVRGDQLVFTSLDELEAAPAVAVLDGTDLTRCRFTDKTSQIYAGAIVSKRDTRSNSVKKWSIAPLPDTGAQDILQVEGRVENDAQAQIKAEVALKNKNREKIKATLSVPGNPLLVAGVNILLTDLGTFSGKWHIVSSTHNVSVDSGYTTELNIRKIIS